MTKTAIAALKAEKKNLQQQMGWAEDRIKTNVRRIEDYQNEILLDRRAIDEFATKIAEITQDLG